MPAASSRGVSSAIDRSMKPSRPLRRVSSRRDQLAVALGLECLNARSSSSHLICQMPSRSRERRVDLHRLAGDALLLLARQRVQGAHVVQPVGELDEDDADVLGHRQEHLADVLGLLLLVGMGAELRQLRDAVDEVGDLGPEALLDVADRVLGVLGDIVEQRRGDRDGIEAELREDLRRGDGVGDVRLARGALLLAVGFDGEVERAVDRAQDSLRVVGEDRVQERLPERLDVDGRGRGDGRSSGAAAVGRVVGAGASRTALGLGPRRCGLACCTGGRRSSPRAPCRPSPRRPPQKRRPQRQRRVGCSRWPSLAV